MNKKGWFFIFGETRGKIIPGLLLALFFTFFPLPLLYASQSTITEVEDFACMGNDKSKRQTESEALANAKRKAAEYASTYLKSETRVKNFQLEKDLIDAYSNATVKVLQELERSWYKDAAMGECVKIKVRVEVIPDEGAINKTAQGFVDDPSAPLNVQVWADKKEYRESEKMKVYLRGNKPFYARVMHKGASGAILQILPNPHRSENYFNGGVIYEIPAGQDQFDLEITPPFGIEQVSVYASTSPLGDLDLTVAGGVFKVDNLPGDIGKRNRDIKIKKADTEKKEVAAEFVEGHLTVKTKK